MLEAITVDIRALSYFDADGNLTRRIAHVTVDGFYIKESTGEALPNRAVWTQIRDVEASTLTITGLRESIQRAGEPPSAVMVGRLVLPAFGPNGLVAIEQTPRIDLFEFWPVAPHSLRKALAAKSSPRCSPASLSRPTSSTSCRENPSEHRVDTPRLSRRTTSMETMGARSGITLSPSSTPTEPGLTR